MAYKTKNQIPDGAKAVTIVIEPTPDVIMRLAEWKQERIAEIEGKGVVVQSVTGGTVTGYYFPEQTNLDDLQ